jgi:hypothetical protein
MLKMLREFLADVGFHLELFAQVLARLGAVVTRRELVLDQLYQAGIKRHPRRAPRRPLHRHDRRPADRPRAGANFGQQDQIGTIVALSMCREMGPFITATILAATVGSAIAAELGTMAVSDELDGPGGHVHRSACSYLDRCRAWSASR